MSSFTPPVPPFTTIGHPNEVQSRNLTLIAKTVQVREVLCGYNVDQLGLFFCFVKFPYLLPSPQNLANLVEFGQKESFMAPMNELILSRKEDMKECLNKFSVGGGGR